MKSQWFRDEHLDEPFYWSNSVLDLNFLNAEFLLFLIVEEINSFQKIDGVEADRKELISLF
jgi:hypothetical protein